jgi:hypothetical protein
MKSPVWGVSASYTYPETACVSFHNLSKEELEGKHFVGQEKART